MARRGGPARKDGARHKNGRLKFISTTDPGHEMTLARRQRLAGADARDSRAGYPLGVLALRGQLADPWVAGDDREWAVQNAARHDAGLRYAADHAVVFGLKTPKSHLAALVDGIRGQSSAGDSDGQLKAQLRYGRKVARVRLVPGNPFSFHVLERIVVDEEFRLAADELGSLRRALAALVDL